MLSFYDSPIGRLFIETAEDALLRISTSPSGFPESSERKYDGGGAVLKETYHWLDIYFSGRQPDFTPRLLFAGTSFQRLVWQLLRAIPYGSTLTYGSLAMKVALARGQSRMSAQAVGNACSRNPILLIVPCHRVVGKDGSLVGFASGIDRKCWLLDWEKKHLFAQ